MGDLKKLKKELKQKAIENVEREFIISALSGNDWSVSKAAKQIGMQRTNLYRLLKRHDIRLPKNNQEEGEEIKE